MWKKVLKIGVPTTCALLTGSYLYRNDLRAFAATAIPDHLSDISSWSSDFWESQSNLFPRKPWNKNWDNRDPMTMVDIDKYMEANEETRKEMLKEVKPTATRHIFLIRHGQYQLDSKEKYLTALGREQAILLGKSLAESGTKFDKCIYSTMNRATETAKLMMEQLPPLKSKSDSILEEGAPYPPEPRHGDWRPRLKEFYTEGSRIEAAFRKYIHRASPKQKEDSYELIVCHANVIRYFICRALQFPPEGWLRMSIGNTGITWLVIRPNGNVSLRYLGEIGHLHPDKLTFT